ncbi:MAG: TonB-dependent receptor [Gammaproteobacteria bacterium]|nr:TonB-dependent receptor [Gammaproteobacteria bacterium]
MKTQLSLIALTVSAANFQLHANDWETITVTGTRTEQSVSDSLAITKIISRQDIELIKPNSLPELLNQVAGIDISQQGGRGQNASVFTRGTNSNHTLVLVDGVRISSATLGSTNVQMISPSQIERIEIVKGPRAAIWGSDAIGGVIQIFTRKAEGIAATATVGSDNFQQLTATVGFEHGEGASSFSLSKEQTDGFDVLNDVEPDDDGYEHLSFTATGFQPLSEQLRVNYLLQVAQSDNDYDSAFWNNQSEKDNHILALGLDYTISEHHNVQFKASQAQDKNLDFGVAEDLYETTRKQVSVVSANQINEGVVLTGGIDFQQENIDTSSTYTNESRNIVGVFAHGQYQLEQYNLEVALRHDEVEGIESETTYNLGVGYDLSKFSNIALSHGTGFKTPTFNDLYYPFGGNDQLISETSTTTEIIYKHNFLIAVAQASVYTTEIDNLIAWAPTEEGSSVWMPFNINSAEITGAEFDLRANYLGYEHNLNFAYTDSEDGTTGEQLIRRAKQHVNYSVNKSFKDVTLGVNYSYKGKRLDSGGIELDAYSLLNVIALYEISSSFSIDLKLTNVLDEDYQTAANYNTQGQAFYLGVSYQQ